VAEASMFLARVENFIEASLLKMRAFMIYYNALKGIKIKL